MAQPSREDCINSCQECYSACFEAVNYCLQKGGKHADPTHIRLLLDCADVCQFCAGAMLRHTELYQAFCTASAEACERCAESCEKFPDDEQMKKCAEICRSCADDCRSMGGGSKTAA